MQTPMSWSESAVVICGFCAYVDTQARLLNSVLREIMHFPYRKSMDPNSWVKKKRSFKTLDSQAYPWELKKSYHEKSKEHPLIPAQKAHNFTHAF